MLPWRQQKGGRCAFGGRHLTAAYLVYALEQTVAAAVQHAPPPVPTSSGAGWQFSGTVRPAAFLGTTLLGPLESSGA